jgi:hypothetical protein
VGVAASHAILWAASCLLLTTETWVQYFITSSESRSEQSGTGIGVPLSASHHSIMLHLNLSQIHEVCSNSDKAVHCSFGPKLVVLSLTWYLAGFGVLMG